MTRVYQDMIRPRGAGAERVGHCMFRLGSHRFPRSVNVTNLKSYAFTPHERETHDPQSLIQRLVKRAICFHTIISKFQVRSHKSLRTEEYDIPEEGTIHVGKLRDRSVRDERESEEGKKAYESISFTPSGSEGTPVKEGPK